MIPEGVKSCRAPEFRYRIGFTPLGRFFEGLLKIQTRFRRAQVIPELLSSRGKRLSRNPTGLPDKDVPDFRGPESRTVKEI